MGKRIQHLSLCRCNRCYTACRLTICFKLCLKTVNTRLVDVAYKDNYLVQIDICLHVNNMYTYVEALLVERVTYRLAKANCKDVYQRRRRSRESGKRLLITGPWVRVPHNPLMWGKSVLAQVSFQFSCSSHLLASR